MCSLAGFASDSDEKPLETLNLSQAEMAGFVHMLSCHTNNRETTINQLAQVTQPGYIESLRDLGTHMLAGMVGFHYVLMNCCCGSYNLGWWGGLAAGTALIMFKFVLPAVDGAFQEGHSPDIRRFITKANNLRVDGKKVIRIKKMSADSYEIKIFSVDLKNIEFKTITFKKKDKDL